MNSSSKVIKLQKQVNHISAVSGKLANYLNDEELTKVIDEKVCRAKDKAFKDGYAKGYSEGCAAEKKKFSASTQLLSDSIELMNQYVETVHKEIESELVNLVFLISETIVRHELSNPDNMSHVIKDALNKIYDPRSLIIKLHPQSIGYFDQIVAELQNRNVDISRIKAEIDPAVGQGGCYIETDSSVIDARVDKIVDEVRRKIQELSRWEIPIQSE